MPWTNHPACSPLRDQIIQRLKESRVWLKKVRPVVLLCGGSGSNARATLKSYLRSKTPALVFYAEDVWKVLAKRSRSNALALEKRLAEFADIVIILVESAGTIAELGAFSINDVLRTKLLPLIDNKYRMEESFINTGPVAWVDRDSAFRPTIWTDMSIVLSAATEVEDRISKIPIREGGRLRAITLLDSPLHQLFLCVLVVGLFGPATAREIWQLCREIIPGVTRTTVYELLSLAESLEVVNVGTHPAIRGKLFFRSANSLELAEIYEGKPFILAALRSQILSVMQKIPEGARAIEVLVAARTDVA